MKNKLAINGPSTNSPNSRLVKSLNRHADRVNKSSVELHQIGKKYVVKKSLDTFKRTPKYRGLKHEKRVLELIEDVQVNIRGKYSVKSPKIIGYEKLTKFNTYREYFDGKHLSNESVETVVLIIQSVLNYLTELQDKIFEKKEISYLPKRPAYLQIAQLWFYALKIAMNKHTDKDLLSRCIKIWFKNISIKELLSSKLVLTHRDIHDKNFLIKGSQIYLIDWEQAVLAEPTVELAITSRYFYTKVGANKIRELILNNVKSKQAFSSFLRNAAFYSLQYISLLDKNDRYLQNSESYISFINNLDRNADQIHFKV